LVAKHSANTGKRSASSVIVHNKFNYLEKNKRRQKQNGEKGFYHIYTFGFNTHHLLNSGIF
jgi:hypothetical protein